MRSEAEPRVTEKLDTHGKEFSVEMKKLIKKNYPNPYSDGRVT